MELKINTVHYEVTELNEVQVQLIRMRRHPFAEIWLQDTADSPSICALVNGESAWLMFQRYEGDAGFSTRDPNYSGPPKAKIEYYLANGQRDEYPASWNITTDEAMRALEYFFLKEEMAPWLTWNEERPSNYFAKSFGR